MTKKKFKIIFVWLGLVILSLIISQAITGFWFWQKGVPLWGELFSSYSYDKWLAIFSQAWGKEMSFGASHLYFPSAVGQYNLFSSAAVTATHLWLESMVLAERFFGHLIFWLYLNAGFLVPFWAMFYLAYCWSCKNIWISLLAGFLFATNPISCERMLAGVPTYTISMGFIPILIALTSQFGVSKSRPKNIFIAAAVFLIGGAYPAIMPHFVIIFAIWFLLDFIFPSLTSAVFGSQRRFSKIIIGAIFILGVLLLSLSVWLPPRNLHLPARSISQPYFARRQLEQTMEKINYPRTLTLSVGSIEDRFNFQKNYPFISWTRWLFPLIVCLGVIFLRKKSLFLLLIIYLVGLVFSVGSRGLFGWLFLWFYENFPGFSAFRDPAKFLILLLVPFILIFVDLLRAIVSSVKTKAVPLAYIFITVGVLAISYLTTPYIFFGEMAKLSQPVKIPSTFWQTASWIDRNVASDSRILLWPDPLRVEKELNISRLLPSIQKSIFTGLIATDVSLVNANGTNDHPSAEYQLYLMRLAKDGQWSVLNQYFDLDYILYNRKLSGDSPLVINDQIRPVYQNDQFTVYQIKDLTKSRIFVEKSPLLISSLRPIYDTFNLDITPIVVDEQVINLKIAKKVPLLLYDQDFFGITLAVAPEKYLLDPTEIARHNIKKSWQLLSAGDTDLINKSYPAASKYAIYATDPTKIDIPYQTTADSHLFARLLVGSDKSNRINFFNNGQKIKSLKLSPVPWKGYLWFAIGSLTSTSGKITIQSLEQEMVVVDKIVLLPKKTVNGLEQKIISLTKDRQIVQFISPEFAEASKILGQKSDFRQLSSQNDQRWQIVDSQENLKKFLLASDRQYLSDKELPTLSIDQPSFVVNLESFDPNWRLGQVAPVHALGYAQGYYLSSQSSPGELSYLPEKIYHRSLAATKIFWLIAIATFFISGLMFILKRK